MTRISVAGGTGQVGREVVRQALSRGHAVAVLSRNPPSAGSPEHHDGATYFRADVTTGEGLAEALAGAEVVVDCLEGQSGKALRQFAAGGALLLAEALEAGVGRAVLLSIINCDQSTYRFYRSKADKERVYARSQLETVTVRATQFHSLVARLFAAGSWIGLIPVIRGARFQTISPADVATALLEAAVEPPAGDRHSLRTVGGPEIEDMSALARTWKRVTGARGVVAGFPLPGPMGKFLAGGKNLAPGEGHGRETFEGWLEKRTENL
ncbi:NmrA family transcriptional regulator [Arthrobacter sp. Soil736]|uniref:SDR family oxidoreductase n=1 Tax=Arthrobacter sp. Soil736 TaxID=1736395 RepID=UPI0006F52BED|nr:NAD(P)H-binding protein [Arthrobacter sp. Soil736]KRE44547.1 NmrA family transcriptional regulator [Arthrobacter sp. Soil736]